MDMEELAMLTAKLEQRIDAAENSLHQIEKHRAEQERLSSAIAAIRVEQSYIKADVREIKEDVKKLASVPGSRWTKVIETVIISAVGAVLALLLK